MSVEVEAAILKIRAELSGDALKQVDKELKKLGLTVAKTGKDGSESLVKIDKTLGKINTSFVSQTFPFPRRHPAPFWPDL